MLSRPIPQVCYDCIKASEGCSLKVYIDSNGCPTVGYGHQLRDGHIHRVGDLFTQEQVDRFLVDDVEVRAKLVSSHVTVPLTDGQYSALISFIYNLGDVLPKSTLLKLLNQKDYKGASDQFLVWDKVNGKYNQSIENRRLREQKLFNS